MNTVASQQQHGMILQTKKRRRKKNELYTFYFLSFCIIISMFWPFFYHHYYIVLPGRKGGNGLIHASWNYNKSLSTISINNIDMYTNSSSHYIQLNESVTGTTYTTTKYENRAGPPNHDSSLMDDSSFSACLLVMDDNHFLIEWLAYHYFVLPLRYVIIAIDPRSRTSPNKILNRWRKYDKQFTILEWDDHDYMTEETLLMAEQQVIYNFGTFISPKLIRHRARQRLFYYKCMLHLKQQNRTYTTLLDTDEFLYINYKTIQSKLLNNNNNISNIHLPSIEQPGSVMSFIKKNNDYLVNEASTTSKIDNSSLSLLSSPCIQIPRIRFGLRESTTNTESFSIMNGNINNNNNNSYHFNLSNFQTLRWLVHSKPDDIKTNKISKVILDISQVPISEIVPVRSIHRPIKSFCTQRQLYVKPKDSFFIINHYLGTWEQYLYRDDARLSFVDDNIIKTQKEFDKNIGINFDTSVEILPWFFNGFIKVHGYKYAMTLLDGVGILEDKTFDRRGGNSDSSSSSLLPYFFGKSNIHDENNDGVNVQRQKQNNNDESNEMGRADTAFSASNKNDYDYEETKCALLFFGFPLRSFQDMILPSITKNILIPNIENYNCDVFVHYYYYLSTLEEDAENKQQFQNNNNPGDVLLLEDAVKNVVYSKNKKFDFNHQDDKHAGHYDKQNIRRRMPWVEFILDTEEDFWLEYNETICNLYSKINDKKSNEDAIDFVLHNTSSTLKRFITSYQYFSSTSRSSTLQSIVQHWHSKKSVWDLMETTLKKMPEVVIDSFNDKHDTDIEYSRIGIFPLDALYVQPIDIYQTTKTSGNDMNNEKNGGAKSPNKDTISSNSNSFAVVNSPLLPPSQSLVATSSNNMDADYYRMSTPQVTVIYGPYEAVKLWATNFFESTTKHEQKQYNINSWSLALSHADGKEKPQSLIWTQPRNKSIERMSRRDSFMSAIANQLPGTLFVVNNETCFLRMNSNFSAVVR